MRRRFGADGKERGLHEQIAAISQCRGKRGNRRYRVGHVLQHVEANDRIVRVRLDVLLASDRGRPRGAGGKQARRKLRAQHTGLEVGDVVPGERQIQAVEPRAITPDEDAQRPRAVRGQPACDPAPHSAFERRAVPRHGLEQKGVRAGIELHQAVAPLVWREALLPHRGCHVAARRPVLHGQPLGHARGRLAGDFGDQQYDVARTAQRRHQRIGQSHGHAVCTSPGTMSGFFVMSTAVQRLVERMYFNGIVFNQSWEDPTMDREALQIVPDHDVVLSITSGGCNCLNLLCLSPREMICVDANPAQTYLMDLKLAAIRQLDYDDFFSLFSGPGSQRSKSLYTSALREALPPPARDFWDRNADALMKGVCRQGKLGLFLEIARAYLTMTLGAASIRDFFQIESLEEQHAFYVAKIAPRIWRRPLMRVLTSKAFIYLAGMHPSQYALIAGHLTLERYIRERAEHLLTATPIRNNYFVAQAAFGRYLDREHVPPYLLESNFMTLKRNLDRVTNLTTPLGSYLADGPPRRSTNSASWTSSTGWTRRRSQEPFKAS